MENSCGIVYRGREKRLQHGQTIEHDGSISPLFSAHGRIEIAIWAERDRRGGGQRRAKRQSPVGCPRARACVASVHTCGVARITYCSKGVRDTHIMPRQRRHKGIHAGKRGSDTAVDGDQGDVGDWGVLTESQADSLVQSVRGLRSRRDSDRARIYVALHRVYRHFVCRGGPLTIGNGRRGGTVYRSFGALCVHELHIDKAIVKRSIKEVLIATLFNLMADDNGDGHDDDDDDDGSRPKRSSIAAISPSSYRCVIPLVSAWSETSDWIDWPPTELESRFMSSKGKQIRDNLTAVWRAAEDRRAVDQSPAIMQCHMVAAYNALFGVVSAVEHDEDGVAEERPYNSSAIRTTMATYRGGGGSSRSSARPMAHTPRIAALVKGSVAMPAGNLPPALSKVLDDVAPQPTRGKRAWASDDDSDSGTDDDDDDDDDDGEVAACSRGESFGRTAKKRRTQAAAHHHGGHALENRGGRCPRESSSVVARDAIDPHKARERYGAGSTSGDCPGSDVEAEYGAGDSAEYDEDEALIIGCLLYHLRLLDERIAAIGAGAANRGGGVACTDVLNSAEAKGLIDVLGECAMRALEGPIAISSLSSRSPPWTWPRNPNSGHRRRGGDTHLILSALRLVSSVGDMDIIDQGVERVMSVVRDHRRRTATEAS